MSTQPTPTLLALARAIVSVAELLPDSVRQDILHDRKQTWHLAVLTADRFCNPTDKARPILTSLYEALDRKREALARMAKS